MRIVFDTRPQTIDAANGIAEGPSFSVDLGRALRPYDHVIDVPSGYTYVSTDVSRWEVVLFFARFPMVDWHEVSTD